MSSSPLRFNEVLLPAEDIDLTKFATVACDQFTSDLDYWKRLDAFVGDSPSALRITYPEIFLNEDRQSRIEDIKRSMYDYLSRGVFSDRAVSAVLTERQTPFSPPRRGLVAAVDLRAYSFEKNDSLIRATEGTVKERIPPRVEIRKDCPLELPHVMLLVEDAEGLLVERAHASKGRKLYDFELNMNGGRLKGWEAEGLREIDKAVEILIEKSAEKYGAPFLFAVGDGNHSLAAAKTVCNQSEEPSARYALCEIVNVYDDGIIFHPIHRLVEAADPADFIKYVADRTRKLPVCSYMYLEGEKYEYRLPADSVQGVALVQSLIDEYADKGEVDYIHGLAQLSAMSNGKRVGMELKAMEKSRLFGYVAENGALPKKTFSMGEGEEKRYYLEARRIKG